MSSLNTATSRDCSTLESALLAELCSIAPALIFLTTDNQRINCLGNPGWYLDKDLAPQIFWGRQPPGPVSFDVGQVQFVSEDFNQILGHLLLLRNTAVVLYGQDDRVAET